MSKILVIRMRGEIGTNRGVIDTFKMLGMKRMYSFAIIENTPSNLGMVRRIDSFVSWGEPTAETEKMLEGIGVKTRVGVTGGLKSPRGGFKSKKLRYPRGNLGNCGPTINDMIKKMI
ncbi:MAG: 50S ribosomal protein L30 [archaeon GW2011_AR5]|nr:MAG: 50S ribosomal protein L30 [archaeon GW2011_AR5]